MTTHLQAAMYCQWLCCCRHELISPGAVADRIYLIARGEVEIITQCGAHLSAQEPLVTGLDVDLGEAHDSTDMWDSTQVSDISKDPGEWGE